MSFESVEWMLREIHARDLAGEFILTSRAARAILREIEAQKLSFPSAALSALVLRAGEGVGPEGEIALWRGLLNPTTEELKPAVKDERF